MGDPLTRKFHWFSYVAGDDIRATCRPGDPDRFRLVYNGIYGEHLRLYEVDSVRRRLSAKVSGDGNAARVSGDDLLAPWRAQAAATELDPAAYQRLEQALAADGAFGPPAVGLELPSRSYYWTAATCKAGRFTFTAWKYPSPAFEALRFPALLLAADATAVPLRPAGPIAFDPQLADDERQGKVVSFTLEVGAEGMVR